MPPPYTIAVGSPAAADIISSYPPVEQTYRTTVLDWLTFLSDPTTGIIKTSALPPGVLSASGYLYNLNTSPNAGSPTAQIDIQPGTAATSNLAVPVNMVLASVLTKTLGSAWVVGSGNGGLDTGAIGNNWYYLYEIQRSDTLVTDAAFSLSATAPTIGVNIPAAYDRWRRIAAVSRVAGAIVFYKQTGDLFRYDGNVVATTNTTNRDVTQSLNIPQAIPVRPIIYSYSIDNTGTTVISIGEVGDTNTQIISVVASVAEQDVGFIDSVVATAGSIRLRVQIVSGSLFSFSLQTHGWYDRRGQDGGL